MLDEPHRTGAKREQRPDGTPADAAIQSCGRLPGWHVVEAQAGKTYLAEYYLAHDGWTVFQPLHLAQFATHAAKIVPLFPPYVFVQWSPGDDWTRICRVRAVARLVGQPGRPLPVPPGVVEDLQARTSDRRIVDDPLARPLTPHRPGERLQVLEGPLAGWAGVCKLTERDRVTLLLSILGRDVPVTLPPAAVGHAG